MGQSSHMVTEHRRKLEGRSDKLKGDAEGVDAPNFVQMVSFLKASRQRLCYLLTYLPTYLPTYLTMHSTCPAHLLFVTNYPGIQILQFLLYNILHLFILYKNIFIIKHAFWLHVLSITMLPGHVTSKFVLRVQLH
jgi:hypothetical protein